MDLWTWKRADIAAAANAWARRVDATVIDIPSLTTGLAAAVVYTRRGEHTRRRVNLTPDQLRAELRREERGR